MLDDVLSFYFQVKALDRRSMQKHELSRLFSMT